MNTVDLQTFLSRLCADEYKDLCKLINITGDSLLTSKVSNHQIIHREHTHDSIQICPLCGSIHIVKNGHTMSNRQKYLCRDCKRSFSDTTNTIAYHSKKSYREWSQVISATLERKPLRKIAELVGISTTTAFSWRHKILSTLSTYKKDSENNLSSRIEADGFFVPINLKGTKQNKMPRMSKKRTGSAKRGLSNHKVCIFTAVDDNDHSLIEIAGLGPESIEMLSQFKERFEENSLLVTDSKSSFIGFAASRKMMLDQIPSGFRVSNNGNNIATINGMHSQIRTFLSPFRGVSIRHLQGYLDLFRFYKNLNYTTEYPVMENKTYCYVMPFYKKVCIDDIYKKKIPIDLFKAYGEYRFGIYA